MKHRRRRRDYIDNGGLVALPQTEAEVMMFRDFFHAMDEDNIAKVVPPVCEGAPASDGYKGTMVWDPKEKAWVPKAPPMGGFVTTPTKTTYKKCDHVQDLFSVGDFTITVTGGHDLWLQEVDRIIAAKGKQPIPDLGIYLDSGWESKLKMPKRILASPDVPSIKLFGAVPAGAESLYKSAVQARKEYEAAKAAADKQPDEWAWPFLLVGWPDQGIIDVNVAAELVTYTLDQLKAGKRVDTGCAGAHGRTGTFLAMLLIEAEKLEPEAAILAVRKRHCEKAIESMAQVKAIFGFAGKFATEEEVKRLS